MTDIAVIHYLVIAPDGAITPHDSPLGVQDAQEVVGGSIDVLPDPRDIAATLIANEEGKRQGLDANWGATALIRHAIHSSDFVAGNVIVAGPPDGRGELTSLSPEAEKAVREVIGRV